MTGNGKVVPTLIGAGIGLGVGYIIGNEWDKYDSNQIEETLENTPSGETVTWKNPDTNNTYKATPQEPIVKNGKVYRDIQIESYVDGKKELVTAKAYRENGRWVLKQ
jgi:surface antigen